MSVWATARRCLIIILQMSHISLKICSSSEVSSEAQIELPKPVFTYVLAQCLNNL